MPDAERLAVLGRRLLGMALRFQRAAEPVVILGKPRVEFRRLTKMADGRVKLPALGQRQGQIIMGRGVSVVELYALTVLLDGLIDPAAAGQDRAETTAGFDAGRIEPQHLLVFSQWRRRRDPVGGGDRRCCCTRA